ncbi:CbtB domain-containing protein [Microbacterium oleivorans]|uniref:CbtB-domain containing protein n=1 Tax=Microbacterium oleivorans TaxID=273677 RepID=A0A7D5IZB4_9MICO|nr:CbtB domain-containing protein [Microbacterium oleivorans]QLD12776.1 CbtB-domain containing protein [Microbacterium oleivorans]
MTTTHTIESPLSAVRTRELSVLGRIAWIAGGLLLAATAYYFVGIEQSAVSVFAEGTAIHEIMHDGRHLLGFPCH